MKINGKSRIGIIGGKGRTGSQFARLFRDLGCSVTVTDKSTRARNRALFANCDVILFAVPLLETEKIMRQDVRLATRKDQLLLDVSSLKQRQVAAMLKAPGEVIGMHPMFAPTSAPMGQTIVLCPARCSPGTLTSLRHMLQAMGLRAIMMTPAKHDKLMSFVQALPHMKSLLIAGALDALGADFRDIDSVSPLAYELELNLLGRFLNDNPLLYGPIIFGNPQSAKIIRALQRQLAEFARICKTQNYSRFAARYRTLQRHFGAARTARARKRSEACIRTLALLSRS